MPIGTFINAAAIVAGGLVGMILNKNIPEKIKAIVFQGLGLSSLLIGIQMALKGENILVMIFSLLIGGILGEVTQFDKKVENFGDYLKAKVKSKNARFTEGFVAASMLFCIGAMAIIGPINEGLKGERTVLLTKSILDGFAAIALAASYGAGVIFSAIPILLYQGSITLLATQTAGLFSPLLINQLTAVGGLLIMGIGINLLEIKKVKVTNLLPSLLIVFLLTLIFG